MCDKDLVPTHRLRVYYRLPERVVRWHYLAISSNITLVIPRFADSLTTWSSAKTLRKDNTWSDVELFSVLASHTTSTNPTWTIQILEKLHLNSSAINEERILGDKFHYIRIPIWDQSKAHRSSCGKNSHINRLPITQFRTGKCPGNAVLSASSCCNPRMPECHAIRSFLSWFLFSFFPFPPSFSSFSMFRTSYPFAPTCYTQKNCSTIFSYVFLKMS